MEDELPGYAEGLRDGKITSIEHMQTTQNRRLDGHDHRISNLERVAYIVLGIVLFLEFAPQLKAWLGWNIRESELAKLYLVILFYIALILTSIIMWWFEWSFKKNTLISRDRMVNYYLNLTDLYDKLNHLSRQLIMHKTMVGMESLKSIMPSGR